MLVVGRPALLSKAKFLRRVENIVDSHVLTNNGPYVRRLEDAVAAYVGAECVAVSNATTAFYLVAKALNLREICVPSFTFIATTHSLHAAGAKLTFLDVMKDTPHIDLRRVHHLPVCAVNLYGSGCDVRPDVDQTTNVVRLAPDAVRRRQPPLIFDSAHALGVSRRAPLGSMGTCEIFSMHATKFISAGEGGLITTRDQDLAAVLRDMRNFGFDHQSKQPHGAIKGWGTNAKMPEINAALGLTNFEDMERFREINEQNYRTYARYLPGDIKLFDPDVGGFHSNYSYIVVTVPPEVRDELLRALYSNGIYSRKYFCPHAARVYGLKTSLPYSDRWSSSVICLPTGPTIRKDDIRRICRVLELSRRTGIAHRRLTGSYN
jgi:dTDP-4-amino-4,6-dideoxygalactose transaminase